MDIHINCIGSGSMGSALMRGASRLGGVHIGFADVDGDKARRAAQDLGARVLASNTEAVQTGDFVFLAVKPQVLAGVLAEIAGPLRERAGAGEAPVLVSMAAGWSIARIEAPLGGGLPVARIMPNTPALISQGLIALAVSPELSPARGAGTDSGGRGRGGPS